MVNEAKIESGKIKSRAIFVNNLGANPRIINKNRRFLPNVIYPFVCQYSRQKN